jgi:hypothetical protein
LFSKKRHHSLAHEASSFHAEIDANMKSHMKTTGRQKGSKFFTKHDPKTTQHIELKRILDVQVELSGFLIGCVFMGSALHQLQSPFSTVGIGLQVYHMQQEGSKRWHPFAYDSAAPLQASDLHLAPVSMHIPDNCKSELVAL